MSAKHRNNITRRPLAGAAGLAAAAVLALSGCASDSNDPANGAQSSAPAADGGAYAAVFEQSRQEATTDFERQVLADNQITRAEYEEATQRYVQCFADKGITVTTEDDLGFYTFAVSAEDDARYQEEEPGCGEGTVLLIEPLYIQTQSNPNNVDHIQLTVDCLINTGLADPSFTAEQYMEAMKTGDPKAFPYDWDDPRSHACSVNPTAAQNG